jgi:AraC family transcriptional regulator
MDRATDTFRSFVEAMSMALDEPETSAAELSARLHLSRFYVDRLVASVVGETPSALRRRVLLERSAYRLLTTDQDVITVAVEAGYGSHEGFTRAFRRAYGSPPSRWRRTSARFLLGGVDTAHFHPPGGLRLPPPREKASMDLATSMVDHHVWLVGQMLDRAATLDDAVLDRPIEISVEGVDDDPTLRSLLARLVGQMAMWELAEEGASEYSLDDERGMSVQQMREWYDEVGPRFVELAHRVSDERLIDTTFVNTMCGPPELFTYGGLVAHVLTFAAHRRTLVCGALVDAGVTDLGAGDPRDWVSQRA